MQRYALLRGTDRRHDEIFRLGARAGLCALIIAAPLPALADTVPSPGPSPVVFKLSSAKTSTISSTGANIATTARVAEEPLLTNTQSLAEQKRLAAQRVLGRTTDLHIVTSPTPSPMRPGARPLIGSRSGRDAELSTAPAHAVLMASPTSTTPPAAPQNRFHLRSDFQFNGYMSTAVPGDTQIAAGHSAVLQVDNGSVAVWSTTTPGKPLRNPYQLVNSAPRGQPKNGIFEPSFPDVTDPWIVYDPHARRWIMSAVALDHTNGNSSIVIAVSGVDDPQTWSARDFLTTDNGVLHDQPKLGMSDDKLVITWEDYKFDPTADGNFKPLQGGYAIIDLAGLENPLGTPNGEAHVDSCHLNPAPVRSMSSSSTAFIVATVPPDKPGCNGTFKGQKIAPGTKNTGNDLWVARIDGFAGNAAINTFDIPIAEYSAPADVSQPGSPRRIFAGDTRVLSALWQGDRLWASLNDTCILPNNKGQRGCFRLVEIATDFQQLDERARKNDYNVVAPDRHLLYPALAITNAGDLFAAVSQVSETRYVGAAAFAQLTHHGDWQLLTFGLGETGAECPRDGDKARIGDYLGADRDPTDPSKIWIAAQVITKADAVIGGQVDPNACFQRARIGRFSIR